MSINPELREWNRRLGLIERAAEMAPDRTYEEAKAAHVAVETAMDAIEEAFRENGFKHAGDDRARNMAACLYRYLIESNPEAYGLMTAEGFGEHIDGPAGERIMAQTVANRKLFDSFKVKS